MRLRTDDYHLAGWKRGALVGGRTDVAEQFLVDDVIEAVEGDVWVIRTMPPGDEDGWRTQSWGGDHEDWPVIGYALTCPNESCRFGVHEWTHASNCDQHFPAGGPRCAHQRDRTSCWTWSGSVLDGTLTASPSLHSPADLGGCGWHGWLRNGTLRLA